VNCAKDEWICLLDFAQRVFSFDFNVPNVKHFDQSRQEERKMIAVSLVIRMQTETQECDSQKKSLGCRI